MIFDSRFSFVIRFAHEIASLSSLSSLRSVVICDFRHLGTRALGNFEKVSGFWFRTFLVSSSIPLCRFATSRLAEPVLTSIVLMFNCSSVQILVIFEFRIIFAELAAFGSEFWIMVSCYRWFRLFSTCGCKAQPPASPFTLHPFSFLLSIPPSKSSFQGRSCQSEVPVSPRCPKRK